MEWDAGGERRGEQGIWGEGEGDEINCSQWTTNASFVFLPLSFTVGPSISFVTTIYRQSLPSTVLSHPHSLLFFAFFLDFLTSMCSFSFSRHGWQRSMSTPSRMWSSCCWATRWDLVANTGRWMDRWTHRGRDHGGRCGGSVPIGFMNVPGSRERDFHFIRITG